MKKVLWCIMLVAIHPACSSDPEVKLADAGDRTRVAEDGRIPVVDRPVADTHEESSVPEACVYPSAADPTPGACQNNTAITCDGQTNTLTKTPCGADEICTVYLVEEYPEDGSPGKKYNWAACIPKAVDSCTWKFDDTHWATRALPSCKNEAKTDCIEMPIPKYDLPYAPRAGSTVGFRKEVPCAADEFCEQGLSHDVQCFKNGSPFCPVVGTWWCEDNATLVSCQDRYGERIDCSAKGEVCTESCDGTTAVCAPPSDPFSGSCSPSIFVPRCNGKSEYLMCEDCQIKATSCPICSRLVNGQLVTYDCQCVDVGRPGEEWPKCIDSTLPLCDPQTTPDLCAGTVAKQCIGFINEIDCATQSLQCQVVNGIAGCKEIDAKVCDIATFESSCEGDLLVSCCPANGKFSAGASTIYCVPGFEIKSDCSTGMPGIPQTCSESAGYARCEMSIP